MNPMSLMDLVRNPQGFINQAMNNNQIMSNPMAKNAFNMIQNHDNAGLEKMARNICKERGIDPDNAIKKLRQQMGFRQT